MKIFVFEPFEWNYCGGAIVVIAATEQRAHELIWTHEKQEKDRSNAAMAELGDKVTPFSIETDGAMFAPYPKIKDRYMETDRWELTGEFPLLNLESERVVTFNYNYG